MLTYKLILNAYIKKLFFISLAHISIVSTPGISAFPHQSSFHFRILYLCSKMEWNLWNIIHEIPNCNFIPIIWILNTDSNNIG